MIAALPVGQKAAFPAWLGFFVLVMPYLAGALAGLVMIRIAPTPQLEAAPLWGLLAGSLAGVVVGFFAKFSGGPLGSGRLATVGPVGAEVGLVAILEVGVTAALVAGAANWLILRHHIRRLAAASGEEDELAGHLDTGPHAAAATVVAVPGPQVRGTGPQTVLIVDESDDAGGHRRYYDPWADDRDA
jgi:Family of unknown function (DUF6350)